MHLNDSPRAGMLKLFKLVDMTCKEPFTCALFTCALVHWHLAHLFIIIKHRCNRLLRDSSALIAKYNDFPRMPSKENNSYFTSTGSQRERKSKPPGLSRFLLSYAADKGHPKFSLGSAIKKPNHIPIRNLEWITIPWVLAQKNSCWQFFGYEALFQIDLFFFNFREKK